MTNKKQQLDDEVELLKELETRGQKVLDSATGTTEVKFSSTRGDLSSEEAEARAAEIAAKKAKLAQVLSRGYLNEKLGEAENVGDGWKGLWIYDRPEDIARASAIGAVMVTDGDTEGLHGTSDGRRRIGDVVLMKIPQEDYDLVQEVRTEQKLKRLAKGRRDFHKDASTTPFAVIDNSSSNIR